MFNLFKKKRNKQTIWIACDNDNNYYLFDNKPIKVYKSWVCTEGTMLYISSTIYMMLVKQFDLPIITSSSEPIEIIIKQI
jgi:hypothetical protein